MIKGYRDDMSHLAARKIAASWHGGGGSALYALSSTGAINTARYDHDVADEIRECLEAGFVPSDFRRDLEWLLAYIEYHGSRGPIEGWGKLSW